MPAPWIVLYITSSAAMTLAAGWQWGLGGAGLALSVLTSAGIGYLARSRLAPSVGTDEGSTLPPDSLPSEGAATTLALHTLAAPAFGGLEAEAGGSRGQGRALSLR